MRKKNWKLILIVAILALSIGFALLSATLRINGTAGIGKNTWLIYWDSLNDIQKSEHTTVSSGAKIDPTDITKVNFTVTLNEPGDFYEFQVDAVNEGTIDAMVDVITTIVNDDEDEKLPDYLVLSITYLDGTDVQRYDLLPKARGGVPTSRRYKVRLEFSRDIDEDDLNYINNVNSDYTINISIPYVQATDDAVYRGETPFADDTWEEIAIYGPEAAKQKKVSNDRCGSYKVGDTKDVDLGDLGVHKVRIANCSTPTECSQPGFSQTACGFVLEFVDELALFHMNGYTTYNDTSSENSRVGMQSGEGNKGSWNYSEMRAFVNSTTYTFNNTSYATDGIYYKLPSDLKSVIVPTYVVTGHGYFSEYYFANTGDTENFNSTDNLYLLAPHEIWKDINPNSGNILQYNRDTDYYDTRQLDYYEGKGVTTSSYSAASKKYGASSRSYFLRTPYNTNPFVFYTANESGYSDYNDAWACNGDASSGNCSYIIGVSPAFRVGTN